MNLLQDGFSTIITFALNGAVRFKEIDVQPPEDSVGKIDVTTMRNTAFRTQVPKTLRTEGSITLTVAYDPAVKADIDGLIGKNGQITITYPDASTRVFWGWLDSFKPSALKEGARPEASVTIEISNLNSSGVETGPV